MNSKSALGTVGITMQQQNATNSTNNSIPSLLFKEFVAMKNSTIATSTPPVFFMIGCQRSGSNWLRTMLGEREDLIAPHPPHIMRDFIPILPKFGNLDDLPNLKVSNPFKLLAVLPATLTTTQEHWFPVKGKSRNSWFLHSPCICHLLLLPFLTRF